MTLFSLQSRRHFGERVLIIFLMKIMAALFDFNDSGRLGRERNLYQGGGRRSIIRRGMWVGEWRLSMSQIIVILQTLFAHERSSWLVLLSSRHQPLALLPPPTLVVQSNSKSNMASQIKTLARPNKTPAVQARIYFVSTEMCTSMYQCLMEKLLI